MNQQCLDIQSTPRAEMNLFPLRKERELQDFGEMWSSAYPVAEGAGRFEFIGWVPAYSYAEPCDYNLYLFYNHEARLALTTFDWS